MNHSCGSTPSAPARDKKPVVFTRRLFLFCGDRSLPLPRYSLQLIRPRGNVHLNRAIPIITPISGTLCPGLKYRMEAKVEDLVGENSGDWTLAYLMGVKEQEVTLLLLSGEFLA